jgi:hypothetical protein
MVTRLRHKSCTYLSIQKQFTLGAYSLPTTPATNPARDAIPAPHRLQLQSHKQACRPTPYNQSCTSLVGENNRLVVLAAVTQKSVSASLLGLRPSYDSTHFMSPMLTSVPSSDIWYVCKGAMKTGKTGKTGRRSDPDRVQHSAKLNPAFRYRLGETYIIFLFSSLDHH